MFHLIMWITGVIFVIVEALLLYFLWKYRHREGRRAHYTHGNNRLEVIWTIVPALICVMLALLSRRIWTEIKESMPADALQVRDHRRAVRLELQVRRRGRQVRHARRHRSRSTSFTFRSASPSSRRSPSKDVIHSFYLPEFRVKQDAVPGLKTRIWFEGNRVGNWDIACAELCGLGPLPDEGVRHGGHARELPEMDGRAGRPAAGGRRTAAAPAADSSAPAAAPAEIQGARREREGRQFLSTVAFPERAQPLAPHAGVHAAPTSFWRKYIFSLDHKVIGKQYLLYALAMLVVGGLLATLVRYQLAWPGRPLPFMGKLAPEGMPGGVMLPEFYNSLFTMHATIMIFFAIMPILIGAFGNFVVPIQIGARDMAFPKLNMMSFWVAVPAAVVIIWSFFVTGGAAGGRMDLLRAALGDPAEGADALADLRS